MKKILQKCGVFLFFCLQLFLSKGHANDFNFTDVKGFEKCLLTQQIKNEVLSPIEIQIRCIEKAKSLAQTQNFSIDNTLGFINLVKRQSAPENALPLIDVIVKKNVDQCNTMAIYEVLTKSLRHPQDYPTKHNSYFGQTQSIVRTCLKNTEFKTDFLDEKDSTDSYLRDNACSILISEKVVKKCDSK